MAIRMALQIPNFSYPDTPTDQIFDRVVASAQAAEASGFDAVLVGESLVRSGDPEAAVAALRAVAAG